MKRLSVKIGTWAPRFHTRRLFVFGLLFAFLAQAQLAAAHFHIGVDAKEQALFGLADSKAPAKGKAPVGDRDCPISQLVAASHNFIAGSAASLPLPTVVTERATVERNESRPVALIALNWQSRAPPSDVSKA